MTATMQTPPAVDDPTMGMSEAEKTCYYRGRKTEKFATAFGGAFWEGEPRDISPETWFDMADTLGVVMPGDETKAAVIAIMEVEGGKTRLPAPDGSREVKRAYYTSRKAARIARYLFEVGVFDAREASPSMWREARKGAGLSENEAPSDLTRSFIMGILDQRMAW